jgi:hypothetical protein
VGGERIILTQRCYDIINLTSIYVCECFLSIICAKRKKWKDVPQTTNIGSLVAGGGYGKWGEAIIPPPLKQKNKKEHLFQMYL